MITDLGATGCDFLADDTTIAAKTRQQLVFRCPSLHSHDKIKAPKGKSTKTQGLGEPGEPETDVPVALSRLPPETVRRPRPPSVEVPGTAAQD